MANEFTFVARIVPIPGSDLYSVTPLTPVQSPPPLGIWGGGNVPLPTPPIPIYPGGTPNPPGIWGPNDPRPTPPIYWPGFPRPEPPPMEEASMDWVYSDGGWFFVAGPYDRPKPICPARDRTVGDPIKTKWTTDGAGWYFVSGPFPRPLPVCGAEVPDNPDPPEEPPLGDNCKWTYTAGGWVMCCGPYDKPKPPTGGGEPA